LQGKISVAARDAVRMPGHRAGNDSVEATVARAIRSQCSRRHAVPWRQPPPPPPPPPPLLSWTSNRRSRNRPPRQIFRLGRGRAPPYRQDWRCDIVIAQNDSRRHAAASNPALIGGAGGSCWRADYAPKAVRPCLSSPRRRGHKWTEPGVISTLVAREAVSCSATGRELSNGVPPSKYATLLADPGQRRLRCRG